MDADLAIQIQTVLDQNLISDYTSTELEVDHDTADVTAILVHTEQGTLRITNADLA